MIKQYKLRFYNFRLLLFLLAISSIGVVLVGTAREDLMLKQLMGVIMGLVIMVILSLIDYSWISNFQWIMYGSNIVLLLIVRLFGDTANGAARWIDFGFIRFQPTELAKIIIILFFARFFMDQRRSEQLPYTGKVSSSFGSSSLSDPGSAGSEKYDHDHSSILCSDLYCRTELPYYRRSASDCSSLTGDLSYDRGTAGTEAY